MAIIEYRRTGFRGMHVCHPLADHFAHYLLFIVKRLAGCCFQRVWALLSGLAN
jgi:hypothetical protein